MAIEGWYDYCTPKNLCPICEQSDRACKHWKDARIWARSEMVTILNRNQAVNDFVKMQALLRELLELASVAAPDPDQWAVEEHEHGLMEPYRNGPGAPAIVLTKDLVRG